MINLWDLVEFRRKKSMDSFLNKNSIVKQISNFLLQIFFESNKKNCDGLRGCFLRLDWWYLTNFFSEKVERRIFEKNFNFEANFKILFANIYKCVWKKEWWSFWLSRDVKCWVTLKSCSHISAAAEKRRAEKNWHCHCNVWNTIV